MSKISACNTMDPVFLIILITVGSTTYTFCISTIIAISVATLVSARRAKVKQVISMKICVNLATSQHTQ